MPSPRHYRRARPTTAIVFALGLLLGATACTSGEQGAEQDKTSPTPVTESKGPAGPVPAGMDKFYGQPLTWGACAPYATSEDTKEAFGANGIECARLTVPLDYAKPRGATISIGVLRHQAPQGDGRIGSLLMNPGGPGASGMAAAASTAGEMAKGPLGQRFDLVGFDPRGVGASQPQVRCLTDAERDADRSDDGETDGTPEGVAKQEAEERAFAAKCSQRTPHGNAMLANLGTRDVAKDMDVLRSALGEPKLNYLGYSYGTRIGSTYAEQFPQNVRSLVLDGALDPDQNAVDSLVAQGEGFGKAFRGFSDWCVKQQDCALGRDSGTTTKAFQQLVQPLIDNPAQVSDGRRLSFEDATTGVTQALYSQELWEPLNSALNQLKQQRGDTLMILADLYNERGKDGHYSTTQDVFSAVRCVDDPRVTDKAKILRAQQQYAQVAPFLDDGRPDGAALDSCAYWPVPNTSAPHVPDVAGVPPALVISTTNDPATPYQAGVNLAKALKGSLLTYEGTQHTVFLQGNSCVDKVGIEYLINGTLPPEGARCAGT